MPQKDDRPTRAEDVKELYQRVPPHSIESEQGVLGSILLDNSTISRAMEIVGSHDFYSEGHKIIYMAMLALHHRSEPIDLITLTEELKRTGRLDKAGGTTYVTSLSDYVPTSAHIGIYVSRVKMHSIARSAIAMGNELVARAHDPTSDLDETIADAWGFVQELKEQSSVGKKKWRPFGNFVKDAATKSLKHKEDGKAPIIYTNLPTDDKTGGIRQGSFVVIAGRPGMGKTMLALYIARQVQREHPTMIASLELSGESLAYRALAAETGIDSNDLYAGRFDKETQGRIYSAVGELKDLQIIVEDSLLTTAQLSAALAQHPEVKVLIVDYLQILKPPKPIWDMKDAVREISRELEAMTKAFGVTVIALAQLSRDCEKRHNKRPMLSDLKESGQIEQDAKQIWFLYRASQYRASDTDELEIIIAKNTFGERGIVKIPYSKILGHEAGSQQSLSYEKDENG